MARVLIFSDIHLRHAKVDEVLSCEEPFDQCILLGDHFDQSGGGDTPEQNRQAALWVKAHMADPRFVFLFGNHEYAWWPNKWIICGNQTRANRDAICSVLTTTEWDRFQLCYAIPQFNLLFSHAGLSEGLLSYLEALNPPVAPTAASVSEWITRLWPTVCEALAKGRPHVLLGAGHDRCGFQPVGGLTWHDFDGHVPLKGVGQIVGHTKQNPNDGPLFRFAQGKGLTAPMWRRAFSKGAIRQAWLRDGWTLCLDTSTHHYAVIDIEDATLTVKPVSLDRAAAVVNLPLK